MSTRTAHPNLRLATGTALVAATCLAVGALASGVVTPVSKLGIPLPVLILAIVLVPTTPLLLRHWRFTLVGFFAWLMVEDLFRKLAGNSIGTYFMKDLILAIILVGFFMDPATRGAWKEATGRARLALYALITWAVVMSVPTALNDWRLPLLGLRVDFLYVPLVAVGYVIARDRRELGKWLWRLSIITAAASVVGIIQATIGPQFLRPEVATPGLLNLELFRYGGNAVVFRPTGTFVEPGRFLSMALIGLTISLGTLFFLRGRQRVVVGICVVVNLAAVWVSGGRTGVIEGTALVVVAGIAPAFADRRPALSRAVVVILALVVALGAISVIAPSLISSRSEFYTSSLDPNGETNEWAFRWNNYSSDTIRGIQIGGLTGLGTGQESLGKQYIYGGASNNPLGLYSVEAGYGSVAVEWGAVGLLLWIVWSVTWVVRQISSVLAVQGDRLAAFGLVVIAWMLFLLFIAFFGGIANFQNYITNVFLWFLSGVVFALPHTRPRILGSAAPTPSP